MNSITRDHLMQSARQRPYCSRPAAANIAWCDNLAMDDSPVTSGVMMDGSLYMELKMPEIAGEVGP